METWAIVVLVVGTNLGTALLALLGIKKQLKYSDKRFAKELEAKREADEHNRKWMVRSKPLLELREELACMAEKYVYMVGTANQYIEGVSIGSEKIIKECEEPMLERIEEAVKAWNEYNDSGKFEQAVHMQYDYDLKSEAHQIYSDYLEAYKGLFSILRSKKADEKKIAKAKDVLRRNNKRISEVQSKINELLEKL